MATMTTSSNGAAPPTLHRHARSSSGSDHANNAVVRATTEGWLELFLTPTEKYTFSQWKEQVQNNSFTSNRLRPLFERLAVYIPDTVCPNILTLAGFLSLGHSVYVTNKYGDEYSTACTWVAVVSILLFFVTTSVETCHAERIRQSTALGDFFKYSCDAGATVFLLILTTWCLGGTRVETQWYAVQSGQLVLFLKHLSAFDRSAGLRYYVFMGPGEVLLCCVGLLATRATLGLDWLVTVYESLVHHWLVRFVPLGEERYRDNPVALGSEIIRMTYYSMYMLSLVKTCLLHSPHGWSKFGLISSLLMRFVPALLVHLGGGDMLEWSVMDVLSSGFFMAVLTSDISLAKMAGREIHPWVVLMSMAALLSHTTILILVMVYYIAVFADLCAYLNMPLLTTCRNVYCDGVYDLCHIGHKLLFQNALSYGNRLYVGVVGDEDAQSYKRPPIMTHEERCNEVEACKAVTKVIPNAPCFGITQDFLDQHQIHVVAYGEEYLERYPNPDDDPYYGYVRKLGIAKPLPRTQGLSTSDLIRRIQAAAPADEKKSPT